MCDVIFITMFSSTFNQLEIRNSIESFKSPDVLFKESTTFLQ